MRKHFHVMLKKTLYLVILKKYTALVVCGLNPLVTAIPNSKQRPDSHSSKSFPRPWISLKANAVCHWVLALHLPHSCLPVRWCWAEQFLPVENYARERDAA